MFDNNTQDVFIKESNGQRLRVNIEDKSTMDQEKMLNRIIEKGGSIRCYDNQYKSVVVKGPELIKKIQINIISLNVNGLTRARCELEHALQHLQTDIILLQETRRNPKTLDSKVNGFQCVEVKADPSKEHARGLLIGVRKRLNVTMKLYFTSDNILASAMSYFDSEGKINKILVINVHIPEDGRSETMKKLADFCIKEKDKPKWKEIIIGGDWNKTPEALKRELNRLSMDIDVTNISKDGTRRTKGIRTRRSIDYILRLKEPDNERCKPVHWFDLADHLIVSRQILIKTPKDTNKRLLNRKLLDDPNIRNRIQKLNIQWSFRMNIEEMNTLLNQIGNQILEEEKIRYIEKKEKFTFLKRDTKRAIEEKNRLAVRCTSANNEEYLKIRKLVKSLTRRDNTLALRKWMSKAGEYYTTRQSKELWSWINQAGRRNKFTRSLESIRDEAGNLSTDPETSKKIWSDHFFNLSAHPNKDQEDWDWIQDGQPICVGECNDPINWYEIQEALRRSGRNKAVGTDGLPMEMFKIFEKQEETENVPKFLVELFNKCWEKGEVPNEWNHGLIVPIPKKGDLTLVDNYRGIAILNSLARVFMKVINNRITTICEKENLLVREQAGFKKYEECVAQATTLYEVARRRKLSNLDTHMCFIDFKKAYDTVTHIGLFKKLARYGIHGKLLDMLKGVYKNTRMCVRVDPDTLSEPFPYERGVRQGCPASPILFNLYINDVLNECERLEIPGTDVKLNGLMFADDVVVAAENHESLERKVKSIELWADRWKMTINPSKCGIMSTVREDDNKILLKNGEIPNVEEYTYLGIQLSKKMKIESIVKRGTDRGRGTLAQITPLLANRRTPLVVKVMIIKSILVPIMIYGCELFGFNSMRTNSMERVLYRALSIITRKRNFSLNRVTEELGIDKISERTIKMRCRAAVKWPNSSTTISSILKFNQRYGRKSTWNATNKTWFKRYLKMIDLPNNEETKNKIKSLLEDRRLKQDIKQVCGRNAIKYNLRKAPYFDIEAKNYKRVGLNTLFKIRTGTFNYVNNLVHIGKVKEELKDKCILCLEQEMETIEHLILRCKFVEPFQKRFKSSLETN